MAYPTEQGYCSTEDVQALIPNIDAYSKLTPELIGTAINDSAVEMDAILSRFYLTPVASDPNALTILKVINKFLARAYISRLYVRAVTQDEHPDGYHDAGYELLDQIVPPRNTDGTQPFPVIRFLLAPPANPTELPTFPEGAAADFNSDNDAQLHPEEGPYFQRTDRMTWRDGIM